MQHSAQSITNINRQTRCHASFTLIPTCVNAPWSWPLPGIDRSRSMPRLTQSGKYPCQADPPPEARPRQSCAWPAAWACGASRQPHCCPQSQWQYTLHGKPTSPQSFCHWCGPVAARVGWVHGEDTVHMQRHTQQSTCRDTQQSTCEVVRTRRSKHRDAASIATPAFTTP